MNQSNYQKPPSSATIERTNSFLIPEPDLQTLRHLETILSQDRPKLVGINGEEILLPNSIYQALCQIIHMMAEGQVISLVRSDRYLSSQEAADLLNVSRPYLYSLLERGEIPYIMVGTHRRIRFEDSIAYKRKRDSQRRQALTELAAESQSLGFYNAADCP